MTLNLTRAELADLLSCLGVAIWLRSLTRHDPEHDQELARCGKLYTRIRNLLAECQPNP